MKMNKANFWNDVAACGLVIGALLGGSFVVEQLLSVSGNIGWMLFTIVVSIGVAILHYYLLHRYTQQRAALYASNEPFTFSQAYNFVLIISAFAGVIEGLTRFVFVHFIYGYSNLTERLIAILEQQLSSLGALSQLGGNNSIERMFEQKIELLRQMEEPTLWNHLLSSISLDLFFGALFGLIIAKVVTKKRDQMLKNE